MSEAPLYVPRIYLPGSKTPKLLLTLSQLGKFASGISLNGRSRLKVRKSFGVFDILECQLIRDVLYVPRFYLPATPIDGVGTRKRTRCMG